MRPKISAMSAKRPAGIDSRRLRTASSSVGASISSFGNSDGSNDACRIERAHRGFKEPAKIYNHRRYKDMAKWTFEPGHTAAEFRARHMMVTYVRGHFKNIHGTLDFDPERPSNSSVKVQIDAREIWTGVKERDDHLRSADFLDVEHYPQITFEGNQVEVKGGHDFAVTGDLTIRGVTRKATLNVRYLGQWETPWWEDGINKGPKTRA